MTIEELMKSKIKKQTMKELAETGASLSVIEAKLGMRNGQLSLWLTKGKAKRRTIYGRFYVEFKSWAADSVLAAQQALLTKNPGKWLDTNTTARVVEPPAKSNAALISGTSQASGNIVINNPIILAAIKALSEAGITPNQPTIEGQVVSSDETKEI
jgi:hypothetical protein